MSVIRINEFYAMPKKLAQLKVEVTNISSKIISTQGCESCEVLVNAEGQDKVVVIERWTSIEAHQAASRSVDPQDFQKMIGLLKGKPTGKYYKQTEY